MNKMSSSEGNDTEMLFSKIDEARELAKRLERLSKAVEERDNALYQFFAKLHRLERRLRRLQERSWRQREAGEGGIARGDWAWWIGDLLSGANVQIADSVISYMLANGMLVEDAGVASLGAGGEARFGRRHFGELVVPSMKIGPTGDTVF